jgi:putative sporulation protein YtxC
VIKVILLSIGYSKGSGAIYDNLDEICKFFKNKGLSIGLAENDVSNMHYIKCILKDTESDIKLFEECREIFYNYASNIIYDFISREYEIELLDRLIKDNYSYLDIDDLNEIKKRCAAVIIGNGVFSTQGLIYSINCRNNILKKIEEYLQESYEIILDGFITFRLKDINDDLSSIIDRIVEEYIVEKEYSEFIKLLKYFVDIQESKYELINIYVKKDGDYIIEDENAANITNDIFEDFTGEALKGEVSKHDILISALITTAPKRLIIHNAENSQSQETIDTLKSIFLDRLEFCTGCEKCKTIVQEVKSQK